MQFSPDEIRGAVRDRYRAAVEADDQASQCCGPEANDSSCCGPQQSQSKGGCGAGYTAEQLSALPSGADLGLGCGNPALAAEFASGETVLDLGSGAGVDVFLAARAVGPTGRAIGVDMTEEMVAKARSNAREAGLQNVEFLSGEIEALPVSDNSVDVIISNCVVNLSPEKARVFAEAYRVLKPGGRLAISDIVAIGPISDQQRADMDLYGACISGAEPADVVMGLLKDAGFDQVRVDLANQQFSWDEVEALGRPVASAILRGVKPAQ